MSLNIKEFCRINEDITALVSFGSCMNLDKSKVDEFADLDLFIFTKDERKYYKDDERSWLLPLGRPISVVSLINPFEGNQITRVIMSDFFIYLVH